MSIGHRNLLMTKLTALAIALLTVITIAPQSQATSVHAAAGSTSQPTEELHAQLIIKIGGDSQPNYRGEDRRRYREEREREAIRRRREYYSQRNYYRNEYDRNRGEYRRDENRDRYRHEEYRGEYRRDR
jgi:hypothetical protein